MMMITWLTSMTTDDWIKIGICWGFIVVVAAIMITTALIDRKMVSDRKKNLKEASVTTAAEEQLEGPEAHDRRMKELYEKVWGPERKREELERKQKEQDDR